MKENNPVSVTYMRNDIYNEDAFLISYDLGLGTINLKTEEFTNICGNDRSNPAYKEGIGGSAKFGSIRSFAQHNESMVIVVDTTNHCIRTVDKNTHASGKLAGQCRFEAFTSQPILDGSFEDAVFNAPHDIAKGTNPNEYYILDSGKRALRKIDLVTREVSTVYRAAQEIPTEFHSPKTMILSNNLFYISTTGGIVAFDIKSGQMEEIHKGAIGLADGQLKSEAKFQSPKSMQLLDNSTLLVLETWMKDQETFIRLLDLEKEEVKSLNITEPVPKAERRADIECLFVDQDKHRIYIGGMTGVSVMECK